ncbi:hypothetical protein EIN_080850 [Entamoeba invadens IP1]|uniref:hypothetical protein n=1 Tax=Entamoeba invadens IP1 TaxID=370355 RepID=UPI0002C3F9CE|nr:hypothetical protein EIN_080850 [Entamoeba invadens IP1]ELP85113.1 hypothetical protein EIN_080850 [Entamoeba invadens IP1]|eukprot:XP_004184459.1 hypothetical protein EIN_080850 [Entamoeba invadens IP1]
MQNGKRLQSGSLQDLQRTKQEKKSKNPFSFIVSLFKDDPKPQEPKVYKVRMVQPTPQCFSEPLIRPKSRTKSTFIAKPMSDDELEIIENTTQLKMDDLKSTYYDHLRSLPLKELENIVEYIPMRLSEKERVLLEIVENAFEVSEYTSAVDVANTNYMTYGGYYCTQGNVGIDECKKEEIIKSQQKEVKKTMIGLLISHNFNMGINLLKSEDALEQFMQDCFETSRRYKAANPAMMINTYQKMMHLLQDTIIYNPLFIGRKFEKTRKFKPIYTVGEAMKNLGMTLDEMMKEIRLGDDGLEFGEIEKKYGEVGTRVIYSVRDGVEMSAKSCGVVYGMLKQLEKFRECKKETNLSIQYGVDGSKLTQSHEDHFVFVQQSLTLWWNIMRQMPFLWIMTDRDFLSGEEYKLINTGQGLQRMQDCPSVSSAMSTILRQTQNLMCGGKTWKGLSVVHLGDRDVPNCLFFIDKYSQVPWILAPVLKTSKRMFSHKELKRVPVYFETVSSRTWGRIILRHFYQHAFDGSGSDGGSCIDGRLTSSWNWCSMIEKYIYYPLFMLCDFEGFDGPYKMK